MGESEAGTRYPDRSSVTALRFGGYGYLGSRELHFEALRRGFDRSVDEQRIGA